MRRAVLAVAGGFLLFAGHPPLDWRWAGIVALVPLLALARDVAREERPVAVGGAWGLLAGVVYFGLLLWWISRFGVIPWLGLALILAVYVAVFTGGLAAWGQRPGRAVAAVVWWVALEAVRGSWPLGGFPWGQLGLTQHQGGILLPVARTLGVLGVTLACAAVAVALEEAVHRIRTAVRQADGGRSGAEAAANAVRTPLAAALVVLVAAVILGGDPPPDTGATIDMAGVQGNDQELPPMIDRESLARIERIVDRMVVATGALADDPPQAAVWPENSLDADTRLHEGLRARVETALDYLDGAPIVAGALLDGPRDGTFLNTMVLYGPDADIADIYVKRILVPFGEYVPLRRWLDWYPALAQVPNDGLPGDEPNVFDVAGAAVGAITCYESIFPRLVRDQVRAGAEVLVISVNNASFGRSPASAQHLAFSRVRAVETGRWVLHSGISGISAVVDPHGRSSQETELFEQAIVRADLPLVEAPTVYVRTGDLVGPVSRGLAVLGLLWLVWDRRRAHARQEDAHA